MGSSKKQTIGYKYMLGMHLILSHGPVDKLKELRWDSKTAWSGSSTGEQLTIDAEGLFGGESREGGVSGLLDFEQGGTTQVANDYLSSLLPDLPGFRGVVGLVLRKMYLGMNPYLKKVSAVLQRVHVRQNGIAQWYDAKAGIVHPDYPSTPILTLVSSENWESGANGFVENSHAAPTPRFSFASDSYGQALKYTSATSGAVAKFEKTIASTGCYNLKVKFKRQGTLHADDSAYLQFTGTAGGVIIIPVRESNYDPLRRPEISMGSGSHPMGTTALLDDTWYQFEVDINPTTMLGTATITNVATGVVHSSYSATVPVWAINYIGFCDNAAATSVTTYFDDLEYSTYVMSSAHEDMNPAHIIRECLTDPTWGMGYQDADIDDSSFMAAADTLYTENFGLSVVWDRQMPIEDFIKEILKTIDATLYVSRTAGTFVLKLIREDYVAAGLLVLDESNVEDVQDFSRRGFDELYNSVTVKYQDNITHKPGAVEVQDIAQIQLQGAIINTTATYPGIANGYVASKVAARDLRSMSTPLATCTIISNTDAKDLTIGQPFKLTWANYDLNELVMRVVGISYGDGRSNTVRIQATQDVFATPSTDYVAITGTDWTDVSVAPVPVTHQIAFEAPYYELVQLLGQAAADSVLATNTDAGYVAVAAVQPGGAINAVLSTNAGAGYVEAGAFNFCPTATVDTALTPSTTSVAISNGVSLTSVADGTHAQIDDEILVVTSIVGATFTFARGALDTVPTEHAAGSRIYFWDVFFGDDPTEYNTGETVDAAVLPVTGLGQLSISDAAILSVTLAQRAYRPYPPGNFQLGGQYFPSLLSAPFDVTWAHRDRLQQTSGAIESFLDANIGPEVGTTYNAYAYDNATATLLDSAAGVTGTLWTPVIPGPYELRVEVESVRGGLASWQRQSWIFDYTGAAGRLTEIAEARTGESGDFRATE